MHAPARAASMTATLPSDTTSAITSIVTVAIVETPTARPSRPSIRFTEFVTATIQITVIGMENPPNMRYSALLKMLGLAIISIRTPWNTAMKAATIWSRNFSHAGSGTISSITPTITTRSDPNSMPRTWSVTSAKSTTLSMNPRNIASPPILGIG